MRRTKKFVTPGVVTVGLVITGIPGAIAAPNADIAEEVKPSVTEGEVNPSEAKVDDIKEIEKEVAAAREKYEAATADVKEKQIAADTANAELEEAKAHAEQKQTEADEALGAVKAAAQANAESAENAKNAAASKLAAAEQKLADSLNAQETANQKLREVEEALKEAQNNAVNPEELAQAEQKLAEAQKQKAAADATVEEKQLLVNGTNVEKNLADAEVQKAQAAVGTKQTEVAEARKAVESANAALEKAKADKQQLEENASDPSVKERARQRVSELEIALQEAKNTVNLKAQELRQAQANVEEKQREHRKKQAEYNALVEELQSIRNKVQAKENQLQDKQVIKAAADSALRDANAELNTAAQVKERAQTKLSDTQSARDTAKRNYDQTKENIVRYSSRGFLGMIEWTLTQPNITAEQRSDLEEAKRIIEVALSEDVSSWAPTLRDSNGNPMQGLAEKNNKTASLTNPRDAVSLENTRKVLDYYTAVENYVASNDPYRQKYVAYLKQKENVTELPNEGVAKTSFAAIASAQMSANRNHFWRHHNPLWRSFGASSEVMASRGVPQGDINLWNGEREYYDRALRELGISLTSLTYSTESNSDWQRLVKKAATIGVTGHYEFFLYSTANSIMGYGVTQAEAGSNGFFATNGTAQQMRSKTGSMTFNEMRAIFTRYETFLNSEAAAKSAYDAEVQKVATVQAELERATVNVTKAQEKVASKEKDVEAKANAVAQAQQQLESAREEYAAKETAVAESREAVQAANNDLQEANAAVQSAAVAKEDANNEVTTKQAELRDAKDYLFALENEETALAAAAKKVEDAQTKLDQANVQKETAETNLREAETALTNAEATASEKATALQNAQRELEAAQTTADEKAGNVTQAEEELAPLAAANRELLEAREVFKAAQAKKNTANENVGLARLEKEEAENRLQRATREAETATAEKNAYETLTSQSVAVNGISEELIAQYPQLEGVKEKYRELANVLANLEIAKENYRVKKEALDSAVAKQTEAKIALDKALQKLPKKEIEIDYQPAADADNSANKTQNAAENVQTPEYTSGKKLPNTGVNGAGVTAVTMLTFGAGLLLVTRRRQVASYRARHEG